MTLTALCITLMLNVRWLLAAYSHHSDALKGDAAFLRISPDRLQFFEYESISLTCEDLGGSATWKGVRNAEEFIPTCTRSSATQTVNCTVYNAFEADSGTYWCESEAGERSNAANITVTAGPVILESPATPVTEGDAVVLRCRKKKETLLNHTADFFKDGLRVWSSSSGNLTIRRVSRSDEGLYKCSISGSGESAESRLTVVPKAGPVILESPALPVTEGDNVTLSCRNNTSSTVLPAVFYKDDLFFGTSSTGNLTIYYVYRSHEGLYKCSISGAGESQGSRLTVTAVHRQTRLLSDHFFHLLLLIRTVLTAVMVVLLLLLVGLLHCGKLGVTQTKLRS